MKKDEIHCEKFDNICFWVEPRGGSGDLFSIILNFEF